MANLSEALADRPAGGKFVIVYAENEAQAIKNAEKQYPGWVSPFNEATDVEAEEKEKEQWRIEFAKREAEEKAKKEKREKAKAEALGLTVEEYKAKVRRDRKIREAERLVERLEAELAKAKEKLEKVRC